MKKHYIDPFCEILELKFEDIVTASDPDPSNPETPVVTDPVTNGSPISVEATPITKAAYITNAAHHTTIDPGELYDPFYSASNAGISDSSDTDVQDSKDPYSGFASDTDASDSDVMDDIFVD